MTADTNWANYVSDKLTLEARKWKAELVRIDGAALDWGLLTRKIFSVAATQDLQR